MDTRPNRSGGIYLAKLDMVTTKQLFPVTPVVRVRTRLVFWKERCFHFSRA